jgi:hypothetical protein
VLPSIREFGSNLGSNGLVARLEDLACYAAWLRPDTQTHEELMFMELARLRSLEAAAMIATLIDLQRKAQQAA